MNRISITDSNQWFDRNQATLFEESTWFDGRNLISKCTNEKFEHQNLYLTKSNKWVLMHWSQWQGSKDSYSIISKENAMEWFLKNEQYQNIEKYSLDFLEKTEI